MYALPPRRTALVFATWYHHLHRRPHRRSTEAAKGSCPHYYGVMGYPDESPELTDRLPLAGVVHHEVYQDYSEGDIDQIYMNKESLQLTKKLLEENGKETLAQIFTDIRYTRADNLLFSKVFLKTIEQQGFMNNK